MIMTIILLVISVLFILPFVLLFTNGTWAIWLILGIVLGVALGKRFEIRRKE